MARPARVDKLSVVSYLIVAALLVWALFPIYWMFLTSIKGPEELFSLSLIVTKPTLENYYLVVTQKHDKTGEFWIQLANSIVVAVGTVVLTLLIASFTAYGLARTKFRGNNAVRRLTLFTYIIPTSFLVIPFFILMVNYGLIDNLLSVIIATTTFASPFSIWVLHEYFVALPIEIEEAALIDGAGRLSIFWRIILPLAKPALVAIATYAFIYAWNEYLYVLVLMSSTTKWTIPLSIGSMLTSDDVPWGVMMSMSVIYSLPPLIFYALFKRHLVAGLAAGAVKR